MREDVPLIGFDSMVIILLLVLLLVMLFEEEELDVVIDLVLWFVVIGCGRMDDGGAKLQP